MKQVRCNFSGSVQGVGFRYTSERLARSYGINGWVKNLPDGGVELVAQGDEQNIELYLSALKKEFKINGASCSDQPIEQFGGFEVRY
ncbi:acylphosphatase [Candidatus Margulisiibacteriota bacterium]